MHKGLEELRAYAKRAALLAAAALWRLGVALYALALAWYRLFLQVLFRLVPQGLALAQRISQSPVWQRLVQAFSRGSERLSAGFASTEPRPQDFLPSMIRLQEAPPSPLGRTSMRLLLLFLGSLLLWSACSKLDIVAVASGKLVPQSYLKVVQPSESGIVKEILVEEGEHVQAGQVLMRLDSVGNDADIKSLLTELQRTELTIRRIDAELNLEPFVKQLTDDPEVFGEVQARLQANKADLEATLAQERAILGRARGEMSAAQAVHTKLFETLPQYKAQEDAHMRLAKEGYVPALAAGEKRRERIEKEQELKSQYFLMESAKASVNQSERKLEQILTEYKKNLHQSRNEAKAQLVKLQQEYSKQSHRQDLLELKAPQNGTVKDLSTHTVGTVVQPGSVLLTLVPDDEILRAEVWVSNQDRGFVHVGQPVHIKFAAFPFQKYGMVDGRVEHVSADATDQTAETKQNSNREPLSFRALVSVNSTHLLFDGENLPLSSGLQVNAEILIGKRTVVEYLLSPVQKATHEAGREK